MFRFTRIHNSEDNSNEITNEDIVSEIIFQAGLKIAALTTETFHTQPFAILKIYVNNPELQEKYKQKAHEHNEKMLFNDFPDSGFDLFVPEIESFTEQFSCKMIDFQIKTEMLYSKTGSKEKRDWNPCGYYLYPRSSISKTPLMLANHTGIIDSGYRGFIKGAFRHLNSVSTENPYYVEKHTRLLQICHPTLCPILVTIVNNESKLSDTTRGEGGFGSTGK